MVEIVSWAIAGVIGLGAVVGFTGVVATSVLTVVRRVSGPRARQAQPTQQPQSRPVTPVG
jgi:hypothetical protein